MGRLGLECVAETTIAASGARPWKPRGASASSCGGPRVLTPAGPPLTWLRIGIGSINI
jgi:hypothetical protein